MSKPQTTTTTLYSTTLLWSLTTNHKLSSFSHYIHWHEERLLLWVWALHCYDYRYSSSSILALWMALYIHCNVDLKKKKQWTTAGARAELTVCHSFHSHSGTLHGCAQAGKCLYFSIKLSLRLPHGVGLSSSNKGGKKGEKSAGPSLANFLTVAGVAPNWLWNM